jgi:hypothetical protein
MDRFGNSSSLPPDAVTALSRGSLIEAIKATRQATGLGLKESKDLVEAYLTQHAALNARYQEAVASTRGPLRWLVLAVLLVVAGAAAFALLWGR